MTTSTSRHMLATQEISLSNGSTLYFHPFEGAPRVAMNIYVHGGNRLESKAGIADMVDDLLTEGTTKRTAEQIAIDMDSLSLDLENDTRRDYSIMSATFLEEDLDASLEFMADMLFNSTLDSYEKEKVRLHGELVMELDSPRNRSHDIFMTELFKDSPYRASHSNILETIPQITSVAPLQAFYKSIYTPNNMLISVAGDIDVDRVKDKIEKYFQASSGENRQSENPPQELKIPEDRYLTYAKDDTNQLHIYKGWFAPPLEHPDYPAMVVLNTILGGAGLTSRLFIELRDKQGLAYTVRSQYESSRYAGIFMLYIGTEPSNRDKALKGFEVECGKLMEHPVGHQELDEAKENILGRRVVYLETAPQQCTYIGNQVALGLTLEQMEQLPERIQAVTALEVQEVAQRYMGKPSIITAVGPSKYL